MGITTAQHAPKDPEQAEAVSRTFDISRRMFHVIILKLPSWRVWPPEKAKAKSEGPGVKKNLLHIFYKVCQTRLICTTKANAATCWPKTVLHSIWAAELQQKPISI